jgi:hypothetical protein
MKTIIPLITLSLGLSTFAATAQENTEPSQRNEGPPGWRAQQPGQDTEGPTWGPRAWTGDAEASSGQVRRLRREGNQPEARAQRSLAGRRAVGNRGTERPSGRFDAPGQRRGPRTQQFQRRVQGQRQVEPCPVCRCPGPRAHLRAQRWGAGRQQPGWDRPGRVRGSDKPGFGPNSGPRGRGMGPMMRGPRSPIAEQGGVEVEQNDQGFRGRGREYGPPPWRQ